MSNQGRFPRKSIVFLDGDQEQSTGIKLLPGQDLPEIAVFEALKEKRWPDIAGRLGRTQSQVIDFLIRQ